MEKTVVITGGTGGLGTALVRRLIFEDYRLVVTYLLPDEATRFEEQFDFDEEQLQLLRVDATNAEAVNSLMKGVADQWARSTAWFPWSGGGPVGETSRRPTMSASSA